MNDDKYEIDELEDELNSLIESDPIEDNDDDYETDELEDEDLDDDSDDDLDDDDDFEVETEDKLMDKTDRRDFKFVQKDILRGFRIAFHVIWIVGIILTASFILVPVNNMVVFAKESDQRFQVEFVEMEMESEAAFGFGFNYTIDNQMKFGFPIVMDISYDLLLNDEIVFSNSTDVLIGNEEKNGILYVLLDLETLEEELLMDIMLSEEIPNLSINLVFSVQYFIYTLSGEFTIDFEDEMFTDNEEEATV